MIGASAAATAALLLFTMGDMPAEVTVRVLSRGRPSSVVIRGEGTVVHASAEAGRLRVDGAPAPGGHRLPRGTWRVRAPGAAERSYRGTLALSASGDEVVLVASLAMEDHVAAVVASEAEPGTPPGALQALAVVARSFAAAAASRPRHDGAHLCDLAHCQVMGAVPAGAHRSAARAAARATAGRVLRLPSGAVAAAPFHAGCGGHTADPAEAFGGQGTGASAVPDPGCPALRWEAEVSGATLARVAGELLAAPWGAPPAAPAELEVRRGRGGWVARVGAGAEWAGGDAFTRALDRALGHGKVRSARWEFRPGAGGAVVIAGTGLGHGVGLCQAGAARRAAAGEGWEPILRHYFPQARVPAAAPVLSDASAGPPAPRWAPLSRTSSR